MHPFDCPQCGYRNYLTAADLEAERAKIGEKVKQRGLGKQVRPYEETRGVADMFRRFFGFQ